MDKSINPLLWIVTGISEETWIEMSHHTIAAHNDYTVHICLNKFIIKKYIQLSVKEFMLTIGKEGLLWASSSNMFGNESLEFRG